MDRVRQILRRARLLLRREAVEQAMDAEIRHHLDSEIEDLVRRGVPLESARRQALAAFGGVEPIKEAARDARGTRLAEDFAGDVRYGWRVLRRTPSVTISSILTFALGIGMAATIFSAVYGVLLRPLPYARPDRLVAVFEHDRIHGHDQNVVSLDNFDAWRERARSFSGWAALMPNPVTVTDRGAPERVVGAEVSWQYFRLLGVAPAIGRDFEDRDAKNGDAVILSDAFWKGRFGGDPSVVGRSMMISGKPYLIAGVMPGSFDPPRFGWLGGQALWFPMVETPEKRAWGRFLLVVARLRDGVTPRQAQAEMRAIASQRENETPDDKGWSATVVPLKEELTANARTTLFVLLGAVSLLLIMAVTNVATLTTSATWQRGAELAVRRAIGATDARLFRQLFVQSALLALFGTAVGVAAAFGGVRILVTLLPPETPRLSSIRVDSPVLAIVTTIAILATLTFGSIAATGGRASAAASDFTRLSEGARGTARRGGSLLISVEIALALALGVMAVLMARSLVRLRAVDLGFVAGDVTVARVALPATAYGTDETRRAFFDRLVERVRRVPGVAAAGLVSTRPLGGIGPATVVSDSRVLPSPESPPPVADVRWADGALFDVLRVVLVSGSTFGPVDGPGSPPRVILTRDLADRFWPAGDAVGHKLTIDLYGTITAEVIGVVGPVHLMDARTTPRPAIFLSATRFPS